MFIPVWLLVLLFLVFVQCWLIGRKWRRLFYLACAQADAYKAQRDASWAHHDD